MATGADSPDRAPARDTARIVLVVCCLLALVLAGVLVPSLTGGVGDSPAESLVPGDALAANQTDQQPVSAADLGDAAPGDGSFGGSGFGALNPSTATNVGGATGLDDSNPFRSQNSAVHFTVTSPEPAYWRTGAYDVYTGTGWRQTGESTRLDGSIESDATQGERIEYKVTLNRSARALPTVWRPNTVVGRSNVQVTDQRAFRVAESLGPGDSYVGVSHRPPQDPAVLRASGRDYPTAIERRYTALPDDSVPDRIELYTNELTNGADNPYETAVAIEDWLETTKTYSLSASRTSDNMADTFIFEMDRGYCEYFATAMTVMLRTQGIPARYVVGYSTGQQTAPNTYSVRALNAHAWVEVYFEDVGWVKFDPTPGSARLQQERQSLEQQNPRVDYSPQEQGSPGETFSPDSEGVPDSPDDGTTNGTDDSPFDSTPGGPSGQTDAGYNVSLNRSAVPGTTVAVTVTRDGTPVSDATVKFNGDPVGRTDRRGVVVAEIPYTRHLSVSVTNESGVPLLSTRGAAVSDGRFYRLPPPRLTARSPATPADVTIPVETNATVTVSGQRLPGETVTVTATVDDVPVRYAAVFVDGERRQTTDASGRAQVSLPERSGEVTITVRREPIDGSTTLTLPTLNVSVTPNAPLALPLTTATVEVSAGGTPVSSASVRVDGRTVDITDVNGTATVSLPLADSATVSVAALGLTAEQTVSGLFVNVSLLLLGLLAAVGVPLAVASRRDYGPRDVARLLGRLPARALQYAQWALVLVATRGDVLFARLSTRLRLTAGYLADLLRGAVAPSALWAALVAWLGARRSTARQSLGLSVADEGAASDPADADRRSIREAWTAFLSHVSIPRHRTKTPGEIARHAVHRDGLPAGPVRVLRDSFREVEYGSRAAGERLDRVEAAIAELEADVDAEDTGETGEQEGER